MAAAHCRLPPGPVSRHGTDAIIHGFPGANISDDGQRKFIHVDLFTFTVRNIGLPGLSAGRSMISDFKIMILNGNHTILMRFPVQRAENVINRHGRRCYPAAWDEFQGADAPLQAGCIGIWRHSAVDGVRRLALAEFVTQCGQSGPRAGQSRWMRFRS